MGVSSKDVGVCSDEVGVSSDAGSTPSATSNCFSSGGWRGDQVVDEAVEKTSMVTPHTHKARSTH